MDPNKLDQQARSLIDPGSALVDWHMEYMREMVRIDSRSFNVNEFEGDREFPTDMKEILECAATYLRNIGFQNIKINRPKPGPIRATPILLAEIFVAKDKPTVLFYAHLDKQPYMDNEKFEKWNGIPPNELRWNEDKTRAYGRGTADDLSGVIAIGMAVDAILKTTGSGFGSSSETNHEHLPCNIKVIYETEEECGSHSLVDQMQQNKEFFATSDCVVITDVINPATGVPGLTTSLRGIVQLMVTVIPEDDSLKMDAQTALYKLLATLIKDDHSLAVDKIARADLPVTDEERRGLSRVPTTVEALRETAGLLPSTRLTVAADAEVILEYQLRKSYANVRPGLRIAGGVIFGSAGARLRFNGCHDADRLRSQLAELLKSVNPYDLVINIRRIPSEPGCAAMDLIVQSGTKDPHSGINGGPIPVAELQLARMIDRIVQMDGSLHPDLASLVEFPAAQACVCIEALLVHNNGQAEPFDEATAKALVEIRLAPGNTDLEAVTALKDHLKAHAIPGFKLLLDDDKGGSPWMTALTHPVFPVILDSLEQGYGQEACIYGCGGSIPFVAKLMEALEDIPPLCIGPYDPDCRMHEPGESLSMVDLLGCTRAMVHFMTRVTSVFPQPKGLNHNSG